jgi:uncharacterized protein (TIGR02757 family)
VSYRPSPKIQSLLEAAYADFHSHFHRERDPVSLVHPYRKARDREIAALATALLSYGNVRTILNSVREVLAVLGEDPYGNLADFKFRSRLTNFRHRFTTGEDLEILFTWMADAIRTHGSIESFFVSGRHPDTAPMKELLSDFVLRFTAQPLGEPLASRARDRVRSMKYLLSDPNRGSACKRLNMFLRWVVREEDGIDLGLWKRVRPDKLILPIDTHLLQTLRALKWTRSKQATWKVAEEATARLRLYAPADPVRYDFALCHLSMSGGRITEYAKLE